MILDVYFAAKYGIIEAVLSMILDVYFAAKYGIIEAVLSMILGGLFVLSMVSLRPCYQWY